MVQQCVGGKIQEVFEEIPHAQKESIDGEVNFEENGNDSDSKRDIKVYIFSGIIFILIIVYFMFRKYTKYSKKKRR